jgi:hypothetical protein
MRSGAWFLRVTTTAGFRVLPSTARFRQAGRVVRPIRGVFRIDHPVVQHPSSMGQLTLNVLLSFAQFEREVIGERVRDNSARSLIG